MGSAAKEAGEGETGAGEAGVSRPRPRTWLKRVGIGFAVVLVVVFWPWLGNPFAYVHLRDSVRTSIPIALIYGQPCATYTEHGIAYDPSSNCYRFDPPKKFTGIWLYEFEGSKFLVNATRVPSKRPATQTAAWLGYDPARIDPKVDHNKYDVANECYPVYAFEISFIGRRNPYDSGHGGMRESVIWPDRILSAKRLPSPSCRTY